MSTSVVVRSFGGGVLSPQLFGRADQSKYAQGMKTCLNGIVTRQGAWENRPGTVCVNPAKTAGSFTRIEPFVLSDTGFVLEFGNLYLRIWYNDITPVALTDYTPWSIATAYSAGDLVSNGGEYFYAGCVERVPAWVGIWAYLSGDRVKDGSGTQIYQCIVDNTSTPVTDTARWRPVIARDTIPCPAATVFPVVASFCGDRILLGGKVWYQQQSLWLIAPLYDHAHTYAEYDKCLGTDGIIYSCLNVAGSTGNDPPNVTYWLAISVAWLQQPVPTASTGDANWYREAAPSVAFEIPTNIPQASLQTFRHAQINDIMYFTGQAFYPSRLQHYSATRWIWNKAPFGNTQLAPVGLVITPILGPGIVLYTYVVTAINPDNGEESLASAEASCYNADIATTGALNDVDWTAIAGVKKYNIYEKVNGSYCYVGTSGTNHFEDLGIIPLIAVQPPIQLAMFATASDYPAVVGVYQQRLCFANTINEPQSVWMSRIGVYQSFSVSTPIVDNDAVYFTIAGKTKQEIRAIVDLGSFIIHTSAGEYQAKGNQFGTITPTQINLVQQGYGGSATVEPVPIGNSDLYVQARGNVIRDLRYEVQSFQYAGKDVTKYAPNLFAGRQIICMAFQQIPQSILWVVLDDGSMVGLTYVREDELWAWHGWHYTGDADEIEWACIVPSAGLDILYLAVKRTLASGVVRYIERMVARDFADITLDAIFMDCTGIYDGRNITAGSGVDVTWDTPTMTVTAPAVPIAGPVSATYSPGGDYGGGTWASGLTVLATGIATIGDYGAVKLVGSYTVTPGSGTTPTGIELEGSATGTGGWATLDTQTGLTWTGVAKTFTIAAPVAYRYYRLTFTGGGAYPPGWSASMVLNAAGTMTTADLLTLTAAGVAPFAAGDVGNAIVLYEFDTDGVTLLDQVTLNIVAYGTTSVVSVNPSKDVPAWAQAALTTWGKAIHHVTTMAHLIGKTVSVMADGLVRDPVVVDGSGHITIDTNAVIVYAGLPYTTEMETLPWENTQGDTLLNKMKLLIEMTCLFYNSRGGYYGQDSGHALPLKQRANEDWSGPDFLLSGPYRIPVQGAWQKTGQVYIKQTDPLPIAISAIAQTGEVGT